MHFFRLKTIDLFESCSIQVGDTHWYKIKDTDNLIPAKQWRTKCTEAFNTECGSLPHKIKKDHNKQHHNTFLGTKKPSKSTYSTELDNVEDLLCMYWYLYETLPLLI